MLALSGNFKIWIPKEDINGSTEKISVTFVLRSLLGRMLCQHALLLPEHPPKRINFYGIFLSPH